MNIHETEREKENEKSDEKGRRRRRRRRSLLRPSPRPASLHQPAGSICSTFSLTGGRPYPTSSRVCCPTAFSSYKTWHSTYYIYTIDARPKNRQIPTIYMIAILHLRYFFVFKKINSLTNCLFEAIGATCGYALNHLNIYMSCMVVDSVLFWGV